MSLLPNLLAFPVCGKEGKEKVSRNSQFQLPVIACARTLSGAALQRIKAVEKGKVYENESQILRTNTRAHTHSHTSISPCSSSPSLCLGGGGICLGKPKGDLACTLHWEPNEESNESPLTGGHICSVTNFNSPSITWWRRRLTTPGKPVAGICMDKERRGEGSSVGLK